MKLALLTTALGCTIASGAFAMPMNPPSSTDGVTSLVRMVCNENGRCWDRSDNPAGAILGGAMRGIEGRSVDRRDGDNGRRGWDRARRGDGYDRRRRHDDD